MTQKPDQHPVLNLLSTAVIWALLAAIAATVLTGYLLPWAEGNPLDIFGLAIPPLVDVRGVADLIESVHEFAGQAFLPLLGLHILGTLKHAVIDRDGVAGRMVRPVEGGR